MCYFNIFILYSESSYCSVEVTCCLFLMMILLTRIMAAMAPRVTPPVSRR